MKKIIIILILVGLLMMVSGCLPDQNYSKNSAGSSGNVAGFWLGLWHGLIMLITFIISWFNPKVGIYEVHNNGFCYNFGFLLGAGSMARFSIVIFDRS